MDEIFEKKVEEARNIIISVAETQGYDLNEKNIMPIARAKARFFEENELNRCPCCAQDTNKWCGSISCQKEIEEDGVCCCNLHLKRK